MREPGPQPGVQSAPSPAPRLSEAQYRTLFETIDEGYCVMEVVRDAGGAVVDVIAREVNRAWEQKTGIRDPVGRRMREVLPDLEAHWFPNYEQVVRTGRPLRTEDRWGDRWFTAYYSLVGDLGSPLVACVFEDVTARKRAEAALEEREWRQGFLLRLSDAFRADPGEEAVGRACVRALAAHLGVERCYITELSRALGRGLVGPEHYAPGLAPIAGEHPYANYPDAIRDLHEGEPFVTADVANDVRLSDTDEASIGGGLGV